VKELRIEQLMDIQTTEMAEKYSRRVEDGGAAADKASKQKHSPTREPSVISSIISDLASGRAR
jgi:hypothetical protein